MAAEPCTAWPCPTLLPSARPSRSPGRHVGCCLYPSSKTGPSGQLGLGQVHPSRIHVHTSSLTQSSGIMFLSISSSPFYFWLCWVFIAVRRLFLWLQRAGATLRCGARASHCGGFSCCGAQALGMRASVVVTRGLSSCGSRALERRLSSCGARA